MPEVDHLLVGAADLDLAVTEIERRTGIRPSFGGVHPGGGTRNAVLALGDGRYLEVIAPDPAQDPGEFGAYLAGLTRLTPIGWAVRAPDLAAMHEKLEGKGIAVGAISAGSRARPDGKRLSWRTFEVQSTATAAPFFIAWDNGSPHPSIDAPRGCSADDPIIGGKVDEMVSRTVVAIGKAALLRPAAPPGLHFTLRCPGGEIAF
jgi:hypothetical protein